MSEIMVLLFLKKVTAPDNHSVKVCFGANKLASYTTSDVAPIILKDVQIGLEPGSIKYEWSLEQAVSDTLLPGQVSADDSFYIKSGMDY